VDHVTRVEDITNIGVSNFSRNTSDKTLGRLRHRWEYNIEMNLNKTGCEGVDRIRVARGAVVNMALKLRVL
jgi:hypothetical protein